MAKRARASAIIRGARRFNSLRFSPIRSEPASNSEASAAGAALEELAGYKVSYDRESPFPVYVLGFLAALLLAGAFATRMWILFALGVAASSFAYYNFPLTETGRARLGANQYGVFIEGFGLVQWRAIDRIDLGVIAVRAMTLHELRIALKQPLGRALIADWRKVPWWRALMRLPWKMTGDNVVAVKLDPFDQEPEAIHRTLQRMWRHYRS